MQKKLLATVAKEIAHVFEGLGIKVDPEKGNCGIGGLIAQKPSRNVIDLALFALTKLEHRGANSTDGTSDGIGLLIRSPKDLYEAENPSLKDKHYATGHIFWDPKKRLESWALFARLVSENGLDFHKTSEGETYIRDVKCHPEALNGTSGKELHTRHVIQPFILKPEGMSDKEFKKRLTKIFYNFHAHQESYESCIASLSPHTVVYQALATATELPQFFEDLQNPALVSDFAFIHRREATNSKPGLRRLQPIVRPSFTVIHNGEFNTNLGTKAFLVSQQKEIQERLGITTEFKDLSDTGVSAFYLEVLTQAGLPLDLALFALMQPTELDPENSSPFLKLSKLFLKPLEGPAFFNVLYIDQANQATLLQTIDNLGIRPGSIAKTTMPDGEIYTLSGSELGAFIPKPEIPTTLRTYDQTIDVESKVLDTHEPQLEINDGYNSDAEYEDLPKQKKAPSQPELPTATYPKYQQMPGYPEAGTMITTKGSEISTFEVPALVQKRSQELLTQIPILQPQKQHSPTNPIKKPLTPYTLPGTSIRSDHYTQTQIADRLKKADISQQSIRYITQQAKTGLPVTVAMGDQRVTLPPTMSNLISQMHAQITNPPKNKYDGSEEIQVCIGHKPTIIEFAEAMLSETETILNPSVILPNGPILTATEFNALTDSAHSGITSRPIHCTYDPKKPNELQRVLQELGDQAILLSRRDGVHNIVLEDFELPEGHVPIPGILACTAVKNALINAGLASKTSVTLAMSDIFNNNDVAMALSVGGADAVHPWLTENIFRHNQIDSKAGIKGMTTGVMSIANKMGITTLNGYTLSKTYTGREAGPKLCQLLGITPQEVGNVELDDIQRYQATSL